MSCKMLVEYINLNADVFSTDSWEKMLWFSVCTSISEHLSVLNVHFSQINKCVVVEFSYTWMHIVAFKYYLFYVVVIRVWLQLYCLFSFTQESVSRACPPRWVCGGSKGSPQSHSVWTYVISEENIFSRYVHFDSFHIFFFQKYNIILMNKI